MRILFLSVMFATLLAVLLLPSLQQAPCQGLASLIFLSYYNGFTKRAGAEGVLRSDAKYIFSIQFSRRRKKSFANPRRYARPPLYGFFIEVLRRPRVCARPLTAALFWLFLATSKNMHKRAGVPCSFSRPPKPPAISASRNARATKWWPRARSPAPRSPGAGCSPRPISTIGWPPALRSRKA